MIFRCDGTAKIKPLHVNLESKCLPPCLPHIMCYHKHSIMCLCFLML